MSSFYFLLLLILFALTLLIILPRLFKRRTLSKAENDKIVANFESARLKFSKGFYSEALLLSSKVFEYTLKLKGYNTKVADFLKGPGKKFLPNIDSVWRAHKLRNKVAHELFSPSRNDVEYSLKAYFQALKELGVKFN